MTDAPTVDDLQGPSYKRFQPDGTHEAQETTAAIPARPEPF